MLTSIIPEPIGNATGPTEGNRVAALCLEERLDSVQPSGAYGVETGYVKQGIMEMNDDNIINLRNMPWLDLGELPISYNTHKSEAFQVYLIPQDELPFNMVVPFGNWKGEYDFGKVKSIFSKTQLA